MVGATARAVVLGRVEMIRVGIVDDETLIRLGLQLLIDAQPDMRVVGQAADGAAGVAMFAGGTADVVLMDIRMPVLDGPSATAELSRLAPDVKVITLTAWETDHNVLAAIRAGSAGFLLKDAPPEEILAAVRRVAAGDAVISPSATKRLLAHVAVASSSAVEKTVARKGTTAQRDAIADLTVREREVLVEIARGLSNRQIAETLYVSEATVKTHVSRILMKLEARDRVQAVIVAFETGLA